MRACVCRRQTIDHWLCASALAHKRSTLWPFRKAIYHEKISPNKYPRALLMLLRATRKLNKLFTRVLHVRVAIKLRVAFLTFVLFPVRNARHTVLHNSILLESIPFVHRMHAGVDDLILILYDMCLCVCENLGFIGCLCCWMRVPLCMMFVHLTRVCYAMLCSGCSMRIESYSTTT